MTSIRKAKKQLKRDIAENERTIARVECMPASLHSVTLLDLLKITRDMLIYALNQLKKINR